MANYNTYRQLIKSGDILAWTNKKWDTFADVLVQGIRIATRSEYSHVGIAWVVGDRVMVVEAVPPLVRIYPLSKLLPFYHVELDIKWSPYFDEKLLAHVGEKYSILQAMESFFTKPPSDNKWQCVELADDFYRSIGINLGSDFTPSSLIESILKISKHGLVLVE